MKPRTLILTLVVCLLGGAAAIAPRIPQPSDYHEFADPRGCAGIANCLNVVSNAAFVPAGVVGLLIARRRRAYGLFFAGTLLTTVGSAYYHLAPDNQRLVWDRLPIAISLAALTAAIIGERVNAAAGRTLLWPLVAMAAGSVGWWYLTELRGAGDLRLYALVQFGCLIVIGCVLAMYADPTGRAGWLIAGLSAYGLAKIFELADASVFRATGELVSGHSLKHVVAAAAVACVAAHCRLPSIHSRNLDA